MAVKPAKSRIIAGLMSVFRKHGYEGASLTALGNSCGLSKAGLYHHFPKGKAQMAQTVLATSGQRFTRLVLGPLRSAEIASTRWDQMLQGLDEYYEGGKVNCLMNTLTLGEGEALFQPAVNDALNAWAEALELALQEFGETNPRREARAIIAQVHGSLVQCRVTSSAAPFEENLKSLKQRYR